MEQTPLWQERIRPGTWFIEGYDVQRLPADTTEGWPVEWRITLHGTYKTTVRSLPAARKWIRERMQ
jgi:hypothetical protein